MTTPTTKTTARTAKPAEVKPEPKQESAASKASRNAPLDLAALSVQKAPAPTRASGAGRKAEDNSVAEGWLRDAWSARQKDAKVGEGRSVTVPVAASGTLVSKLRRAARSLELGLSVQVIENGDKATVNFAPKVAKVYKKKDA